MREQEDTPEKKHAPSNMQLLKRLLGMAWMYRRGTLSVIGLNLVMVAFMISGLGMLGVGVDYIRYFGTPKKVEWLGIVIPGPDVWSPWLTIPLIAAGVLTVAVLRGVLRYSTVALHAHVAQRIVVELRAKVYEKLQRLSFRFYDANESGSIINRVTGDVQGVRMFVDNVMVQVITVVTTLVVFLLYMARIHLLLTLACMATIPIMWLVTVLFASKGRPMYLRARERVDHTIRVLAENVLGMHVVKCFNRSADEIEKFKHSNANVCETRCRIFWWVSVFVPSIGLLTQVNILVLLIYGGYLVISYDQQVAAGVVRPTGISLGELLVFSALLRQFGEQVSMVANITNSIQQALTGAQRVFEVIDAEVEIKDKPNATSIPKARGAVAFENVHFSYNGEDPVLEDVSFRVEPGQCVAILGATGAGKSTLLSLIPRFYDVTRGRLLIDDVDVRDLNLDELRRNIGIVFQESFLFSTSVAANIAFGHPDATREQVRKAAQIAAAAPFIEELEEGYDTEIGENGADLSGGQRQRIAIARAVLLEPSILLLDDATSAIDPETEHEIMSAMNNAMKGRTTFVVAHRLSTLRRADLVVVLEKGQIVQIGTHDDLMTSKGHYRRAARLQVADDESRRLLGVGSHPDEDALDMEVTS